jgi:hypothetical protein
MAHGTRMGGGRLRPGEKPVLPPPLPQYPPRIERPEAQQCATAAIALVATLDIEAVIRQHLSGQLPPAIWSAYTALGRPEWMTVCRKAIRTQRSLLNETDDSYRALRRDEPLLLADFLPVTRP